MSTPQSEILLDVQGLQKFFHTRSGKVAAVSDVSFTVPRGTVVGLVGESGSGKTTAARCVLRLTEPSGGRALYEGTDLFALSQREMDLYRRRLQIVFQDPYSSLNPRMRVDAIIGEALSAGGIKRGDHAERVADLLEQVGLSPTHSKRYPHEFSGGQRQRIGIARALAVRPELIVADEPVSALDVSVQAQILNLIQDLQQQHRMSMLFIAHDLSVVQYLCDEVVVMYLGRVMERGSTKQVYGAPRHPYTRALLSSTPVLDPDARSNRIVLKGDIPSPLNPPTGCVFRTRCPHATADCADVVPSLETVGQNQFAACIRLNEI